MILFLPIAYMIRIYATVNFTPQESLQYDQGGIILYISLDYMQGHKPKASSKPAISSYSNCKKQITKPTFAESFKEIITNIGFNIQGLAFPKYFRSQSQTQPLKDKANCWLLGVKMDEPDFIAEHKKIIWFTYKTKLQINAQVHTDAGWGCLLRVTQMALAHALTRFFELTQQRVDKNYIITPFLEEKGGEFKYSLYQLLEKGYHMWRLRPQTWYSMTQASTIIESLHNTNPLKGSQNLKVKVYNQIINIKEITQIMNLQFCACQDKQVGCQICLINNQGREKRGYMKIKPIESIKKDAAFARFEKHVLLIVTAKLGETKIGKQQFASLLKIMQLPIFAGCLGGIPNKARFLTGCQQGKLSYLDPHYVSDCVHPMKLNKNLQIFTCKQVRFTARQQLDPQMGICFYLSNQRDLSLLVEELNQINSTCGGEFIRYDWGDNEFEVLAQQNKTGRCITLKQHFEDLEESFSDLDCSNADSSFIME